jgi:hypothetical protein
MAPLMLVERKSGQQPRFNGLDCCYWGSLVMDTQSCPNCKSPEVTAALTMGPFAYLRCSECTNVWPIRERRDGLPSITQRYRGKDRRLAPESPVIHNNNARLST